jgi:hypothetical protein
VTSTEQAIHRQRPQLPLLARAAPTRPDPLGLAAGLTRCSGHRAPPPGWRRRRTTSTAAEPAAHGGYGFVQIRIALLQLLRHGRDLWFLSAFDTVSEIFDLR